MTFTEFESVAFAVVREMLPGVSVKVTEDYPLPGSWEIATGIDCRIMYGREFRIAMNGPDLLTRPPDYDLRGRIRRNVYQAMGTPEEHRRP